MSYRIEISEIAASTIAVATGANLPQDRKLYEQVVDQLDVAAVINAVNGVLPRRRRETVGTDQDGARTKAEKKGGAKVGT